jgi:hypothetical protein
MGDDSYMTADYECALFCLLLQRLRALDGSK